MGEFGQYLRQLREAQGESPERVSSATRVPVRHLISLESEEFQSLPSDASARGFVRLLARHYKIDERDLLRRYEGAVAPLGPVFQPIPLSQTNATIIKVQSSGRHAGLGVGIGVVIVILLALGWIRNNQPMGSAPELAAQKRVAVNKAPAPNRPAPAQPPVTEPPSQEAAPMMPSPELA